MAQITHFEMLLFSSGGNLVRVELVYMQHLQYKCDSQALFCFVLILRMTSLDTLFLCSMGQQALFSSYILCQNQGFCTYKNDYSTFPSILPEFYHLLY